MAIHPKGIPFYHTMAEISDEVVRARAKHPANRHMLGALMEEVGELSQALLQGKGKDEIEKEAIQVACVAIRIVEEGDADYADGEKGKP